MNGTRPVLHTRANSATPGSCSAAWRSSAVTLTSGARPCRTLSTNVSVSDLWGMEFASPSKVSKDSRLPNPPASPVLSVGRFERLAEGWPSMRSRRAAMEDKAAMTLLRAEPSRPPAWSSSSLVSLLVCESWSSSGTPLVLLCSMRRSAVHTRLTEVAFLVILIWSSAGVCGPPSARALIRAVTSAREP
jgi:hypothetical protein